MVFIYLVLFLFFLRKCRRVTTSSTTATPQIGRQLPAEVNQINKYINNRRDKKKEKSPQKVAEDPGTGVTGQSRLTFGKDILRLPKIYHADIPKIQKSKNPKIPKRLPAVPILEK